VTSGIEPSTHGQRFKTGSFKAAERYAIVANDVALVRMEDSEGRPIVQNYHNPNHTIGPACPLRTVADWEAALQSRDMAEVLRTLVWLGGMHSDPPIENAGNLGVEDAEDAKRALDVRRSPAVEQAIGTLVKSKDEWVVDAARQALRAVRETKRETHE
jgi:hypothetical protein